LLGGAGDSGDVTGIVMLDSGPVLIDSSAILTSNSDGPSVGRLIMGRLLDADETVRLAGMTHIPIEIERVDSARLPRDFRDAAAAITNEKPTLIRPDAFDSLAAYQELHDIYSKPVAILRVVLPRKIYGQGRTSLLQFLLLLLAAGAAFGSLTLYLLERFVISRVGRLSDDITQVGASGDLGRRLRVSGHDELRIWAIRSTACWKIWSVCRSSGSMSAHGWR
jgi:adenylate cyclase